MSNPVYTLRKELASPPQPADHAEADALRAEIVRLKALVVSLSAIIARNVAAETKRLTPG